jgi:amino acid permease
MRRFAIPSMIGVWAILACAIAIIARFVLTYTRAVDSWPVPVAPAHAWRFWQPNFFPAIGGISYIYTCHDMSIHVLHSLHNPTRSRWALVAGGTMAIAFAVCALLGLSGYLLFFQSVTGNVLDSFAHDDTLAIAGRALLAVNALSSIPYSAIMPRVVVQSVVKLWRPDLVEKRAGNRFARNVVHTLITLVLQAGAATLALHVTDLGLFYEVVGGVSSLCVSLIIPPICFLLQPSVAAAAARSEADATTKSAASHTTGGAAGVTTALLATTSAAIGYESVPRGGWPAGDASTGPSVEGGGIGKASAVVVDLTNSEPTAAEAAIVAGLRWKCYALLVCGLVGMGGCLGSIFFGTGS